MMDRGGVGNVPNFSLTMEKCFNRESIRVAYSTISEGM